MAEPFWGKDEVTYSSRRKSAEDLQIAARKPLTWTFRRWAGKVEAVGYCPLAAVPSGRGDMSDPASATVESRRFTIGTVTPECRRIVDRAEHGLIALSPFNSHYKPAHVRELVSWCHARFTRVDIFAPGYEAAYTLTAAGIAPHDAVRRVRQAVNTLRTAAAKALAACGDREPHLSVHTWTTLAARPAYRASLTRVRAAYAEDPVVRQACREMARLAVRTNSGAEPDEAQLDIAVRYPLAELPLIVDSPAIFGAPSSVFLYHREMGPFMALVHGASPMLTLAPGQAFGIVQEDGR